MPHPRSPELLQKHVLTMLIMIICLSCKCCQIIPCLILVCFTPREMGSWDPHRHPTTPGPLSNVCLPTQLTDDLCLPTQPPADMSSCPHAACLCFPSDGTTAHTLQSCQLSTLGAMSIQSQKRRCHRSSHPPNSQWQHSPSHERTTIMPLRTAAKSWRGCC